MGRKKGDGAGGRKKPNRKGVSLAVWVYPELRAAVDQYIERARPQPSLTSVVETALEDFLKAQGVTIPPPARDGADEKATG